MTPVIIKIVAGTIATLAFAILFKVKAKLLPYATFGGLVACVIYFILTDTIGGAFIPNVVAAFIVALLSEVFARIKKAASTVFLFPGCIALVPGGTLYYTMNSLLSKNYNEAFYYFLTTLTVGIAIGGGIIAASLVIYLTTKAYNRFNK